MEINNLKKFWTKTSEGFRSGNDIIEKVPNKKKFVLKNRRTGLYIEAESVNYLKEKADYRYIESVIEMFRDKNNS